MIVDGLTKAFSAGIHNAFVKMIGLEDQSDLLKSIQDKEEAIQSRSGPENSVTYR